MTRDVLVSITGARFSEHDKEDVEMIIGGDYFWKNGKHYVLYEEVMEESGEVVKNTVKITPDSMDILKKGSINYRNRRLFESRCGICPGDQLRSHCRLQHHPLCQIQSQSGRGVRTGSERNLMIKNEPGEKNSHLARFTF